MENSEVIVWLDSAAACGYLRDGSHHELVSKFEEVGRMLQYTMNNPERFR